MLCGSPPRAYNRKDPGPAIPDPARFCIPARPHALDEEELYQEQILDHYEDPYHRGQCPALHASPRGRQPAVRRPCR